MSNSRTPDNGLGRARDLAAEVASAGGVQMVFPVRRSIEKAGYPRNHSIWEVLGAHPNLVVPATYHDQVVMVKGQKTTVQFWKLHTVPQTNILYSQAIAFGVMPRSLLKRPR